MTAPASEVVALTVFVAALLAAAFTDLRRYLIPNRYPAAIALAYALYATGHPLEQGLLGLGCGVVMLVLGAILLALGVMGGGDAKLLAAAALWAGPALAPSFLMVTALAGAAIALAWLTPFRRLMPAAPEPVETPAPPRGGATDLRARLAQPVPYGVAITAGGLHVAALHALN
jgi:prepilin peptidase CpaA